MENNKTHNITGNWLQQMAMKVLMKWNKYSYTELTATVQDNYKK